MRLNIKPEPTDIDRINRLLTFANMNIQSQQQVFDLWSQDPNVLKVQQPDGTVGPYLAGSRLPTETFLEPFLHDQQEVKNALADLADGLDIGGLLEEVQGKLRDKLHGVLTVSLTHGRLNLGIEPVLDGVEACIYYALALLFHYGMDGLVRRCRYEKEDGKPCGRFFLYTFRRRNYCELKGHAKKGKEQAVLKAIRKWQRGEGPRMGSRKKKSQTKKGRKK